MRWVRRLTGPWLGVHQQYAPRPLRLSYVTNELGSLSALPSIKIVTPSFNQGKFIGRTIQSVLDQHYPSLEYVVQDGGSSDNTLAVLRQLSGSPLRWESTPDSGQAEAINRGFQRTTAEVMAYLNSDDLLLPGALPFVGRYFSTHPEVDVVYGHRLIIDENDAEIGRWILPPHRDDVFLWNNYIPQETLFWRRRLWEAVGGGFDETLHYALDWDLLLRFRRAGGKFVRLRRFLGAFRCHSKQKSAARLADLGVPEMRQLRQRQHGRAVGPLEARLRVLPVMLRHVPLQWLHHWGLLKSE